VLHIKVPLLRVSVWIVVDRRRDTLAQEHLLQIGAASWSGKQSVRKRIPQCVIGGNGAIQRPIEGVVERIHRLIVRRHVPADIVWEIKNSIAGSYHRLIADAIR
jgi:hypothetical protein